MRKNNVGLSILVLCLLFRLRLLLRARSHETDASVTPRRRDARRAVTQIPGGANRFGAKRRTTSGHCQATVRYPRLSRRSRSISRKEIAAPRASLPEQAGCRQRGTEALRGALVSMWFSQRAWSAILIPPRCSSHPINWPSWCAPNATSRIVSGTPIGWTRALPLPVKGYESCRDEAWQVARTGDLTSSGSRVPAAWAIARRR